MNLEVARSPQEISRLLVIAAMDVEINAILSRLPQFEGTLVHEALGIRATTSSIGRRSIFVVRSGVGLVNAALSTALSMDLLKPEAVLLLGVAGSVDKSLDIGDVVIANRIVQHDALYSGETGDELMAPGELHLSVAHENRVPPPLTTHPGYTAWLSKNIQRSNTRSTVGTLLSGSEFVGRTNRKLEIAKLDPESMAVEMEAAGAAQVARKYGIPVMVIKTIADRLNPDGSISSDYLRFSSSAAETAAAVVGSILTEWGE